MSTVIYITVLSLCKFGFHFYLLDVSLRFQSAGETAGTKGHRENNMNYFHSLPSLSSLVYPIINFWAGSR